MAGGHVRGLRRGRRQGRTVTIDLAAVHELQLHDRAGFLAAGDWR
ncbi:MAG TPA: hypothetical protein VGQ67_15000 [Candidatus Polarisedimenticolia bacterium]|nr:hypothetical protein [Candidatus Polarisedimenticolia bacterium]